MVSKIAIMGEKPMKPNLFLRLHMHGNREEVGSLEFITNLDKLANFLLETHMSEMGGIQFMERYHYISFYNNLSRFLWKCVESAKALN